MTVQNNRKILFGFPFREYIKWMVEYFHIIDSVKRSIIPNFHLDSSIIIFMHNKTLICTVNSMFYWDKLPPGIRWIISILFLCYKTFYNIFNNNTIIMDP